MVRVNKNQESLCVLLSSHSKQVILTFFYSLIVAYTLKIKKNKQERMLLMYIVLVHTFWELVLVTKQNILNVLYIKHVDFLLHIGLN